PVDECRSCGPWGRRDRRGVVVAGGACAADPVASDRGGCWYRPDGCGWRGGRCRRTGGPVVVGVPSGCAAVVRGIAVARRAGRVVRRGDRWGRGRRGRLRDLLH